MKFIKLHGSTHPEDLEYVLAKEVFSVETNYDGKGEACGSRVYFSNETYTIVRESPSEVIVLLEEILRLS